MYTYDYQMTSPCGRSGSGRLTGARCCDGFATTIPGKKASVSVKTVYEAPEGRDVNSAEAKLTFSAGE